MGELFIKMLNISLVASYFIGAIILIRILFKRIPKYLICVLWLLVGIRLVVPISIESAFSVIPSSDIIEPDIVYSNNPTIDTGMENLNEIINNNVLDSFKPKVYESANPLQIAVSAIATIWIIGIVIMVAYGVYSYFRIKKGVAASIEECKGIYICDYIQSPFLLGLFKPCIYIPSTLETDEKELIVMHENAHIKRRDYIWKPLAYVILSIYWFNPIVWIGYLLLCRDIEAACDEKVISTMDDSDVKLYSSTLVKYSVSRQMISACPVAFGEIGVKGRIKRIMNYKKPAFWIIVIAVIACFVLGVIFLTNPISKLQSDDLSINFEEYKKNGGKLSDLTYGQCMEFILQSGVSVPNPLWSDVISIYVKDVIIESENNLFKPYFAPYSYTLLADFNTNVYNLVQNFYGANEEIYNSSYEGLDEKVENLKYSLEELFENEKLLCDKINEVIERTSSDYIKTGEMCVSDCVVLDKIISGETNKKLTVYAWVYTSDFIRDEEILHEVGGGVGPMEISFVTADNGVYYLNNIWMPRDGSYYKKDLEQRFSKKALDVMNKIENNKNNFTMASNNYIKLLNNHDKSNLNADGSRIDDEGYYIYNDFIVDYKLSLKYIFDKIISDNLGISSNPEDYIKKNETEYLEILKYREYGLRYIYEEFLKGGRTDLYGHVLARAMEDIIENLGGELIKLEYSTGQEYFDSYKDYVMNKKDRNFLNVNNEDYDYSMALLYEIINKSNDDGQ